MPSSQTVGRIIIFALVAAAGFATAMPASAGPDRLDLANGIRATVYSSDYLRERLVADGARGTITLDDGSRLNVVTDINDPLIANKGDGQFHPFDTDQVVGLIAEIGYPDLDLEVDIYLLPYPQSDVLVSSTAGRRVYLSPAVGEISRQHAAYIVAHEIGHVFQHRYLPVAAKRAWQQYRRVRGIEDGRFSGTAAHAYRPTEIFAEDFRVLFGGPAAYYDGRVENPELTSPVGTPVGAFFLKLRSMTGERNFIADVSNYPNPFNPVTELRVELTDDFIASGETVTIRIYDVRGALVRDLYSGNPAVKELRARWDGRDRNGRDVASATYFGVVTAGRSTMTRKLIMIK